ncbi:MAG: B12-binding domain-containing radical SAM protein, partial [Bdellovibrionales bacterium]|nr:B12-binding domain-containing radical SAM protein [Bdellovibrionales bacterium]
WSYSNFRDWANEEEFSVKTLPVLMPKIPPLVDEVLNWQPDIVGFSLYDTSINCGRVFALEFKKHRPGLPVVYGGPGAGVWNLRKGRDFERGAVDVVVVGEGESTGLEVVERLKQGQAMSGCLGTLHMNDQGEIKQELPRSNTHLNDLPVPYFGDFNFHDYRHFALPIMMSRGCVAKCTFCSETRFWNKFRYREADHVIREMTENRQEDWPTHYLVADSLLNGNFRVLGDLARQVIEKDLRITWGGYARLDRRMTPELLSALHRSGCQYLSYGLETGSQAVMDAMEKHTTVEVSKQVIRDTFLAGIEVHLNIVVGFPTETEEDFQQTLDFLTECRDWISIVNTGETCGIAANTPLWDDPHRFFIATDVAGRVKPGIRGEWESQDGANNADVRHDRLHRLRSLLDQWSEIIWFPRGPRPNQMARRHIPEFHP